MEEYCKKENIFFNENDRIKHQIKKSKGLYQEFKGSLQRGFKNFKHHDDHPHLEALLKDTKEKDDGGEAAIFSMDKDPFKDGAHQGVNSSHRRREAQQPWPDRTNQLAEAREDDQRNTRRIKQEFENI